MGTCQTCGMPEELCLCNTLDRQDTGIRVSVVKRRFGKLVTVINGIDKHDLKEIASKLKSKLACGGTAKDKSIELQGDHKRRLKGVLVSLGFDEHNIQIK